MNERSCSSTCETFSTCSSKFCVLCNDKIKKQEQKFNMSTIKKKQDNHRRCPEVAKQKRNKNNSTAANPENLQQHKKTSEQVCEESHNCQNCTKQERLQQEHLKSGNCFCQNAQNEQNNAQNTFQMQHPQMQIMWQMLAMSCAQSALYGAMGTSMGQQFGNAFMRGRNNYQNFASYNPQVQKSNEEFQQPQQQQNQHQHKQQYTNVSCSTDMKPNSYFQKSPLTFCSQDESQLVQNQRQTQKRQEQQQQQQSKFVCQQEGEQKQQYGINVGQEGKHVGTQCQHNFKNSDTQTALYGSATMSTQTRADCQQEPSSIFLQQRGEFGPSQYEKIGNNLQAEQQLQEEKNDCFSKEDQDVWEVTLGDQIKPLDLRVEVGDKQGGFLRQLQKTETVDTIYESDFENISVYNSPTQKSPKSSIRFDFLQSEIVEEEEVRSSLARQESEYESDFEDAGGHSDVANTVSIEDAIQFRSGFGERILLGTEEEFCGASVGRSPAASRYASIGSSSESEEIGSNFKPDEKKSEVDLVRQSTTMVTEASSLMASLSEEEYSHTIF